MSELLVENLDTTWAEWKYGYTKPIGIARSVSAIVSVIASSLLIWMIMRSKERLTTTYNRLIFGMSISDILLSLSWVSFNAVAPSEMSYMIWNARGNQGTCDAKGFLTTVGAVSGVLYICSLNIYYLAKVKYNKGGQYISSKIEPFLHGVPIVIALIYSITMLGRHNYNSDLASGNCTAMPVHDPPHCAGYEDGQVPEGFEIPCGRGSGGENFYSLSKLIVLFIPPIVVSISLGMIFSFVHKQEKRTRRYGAGAVNNSTQHTANSAAGGENSTSNKISINSIVSFMKTSFGKKSSRSNSNQEYTMSRAVFHRALAYSAAYFLTWGWAILSVILKLAGVWNPRAPIVYDYFGNIFNPLQGFFNLLIFMHPNVMRAKRSPGDDISWCRAFAQVFRSNTAMKFCGFCCGYSPYPCKIHRVVHGSTTLSTSTTPFSLLSKLGHIHDNIHICANFRDNIHEILKSTTISTGITIHNNIRGNILLK